MSSFKKRAKSVQRKHRERGQPSVRKHLGLLEKHKDYVERSASYKKKAAQLKRLHEKARNRNKDEFYYKMINSRLRDGRHVIPQSEESYTTDQLKVMKTQDLKYVQLKLSVEKRKIEQLQSSLHQTDEGGKFNTHLVFVDDSKEADEEYSNDKGEQELEMREEEEGNEEDESDIFTFKDLSKFGKEESDDDDGTQMGRCYKELDKRLKRCQELKQLGQEMQLQKHLINKKEKRVKIQNEGGVLYKWLPERKR